MEGGGAIGLLEQNLRLLLTISPGLSKKAELEHAPPLSYTRGRVIIAECTKKLDKKRNHVSKIAKIEREVR